MNDHRLKSKMFSEQKDPLEKIEDGGLASSHYFKLVYIVQHQGKAGDMFRLATQVRALGLHGKNRQHLRLTITPYQSVAAGILHVTFPKAHSN